MNTNKSPLSWGQRGQVWGQLSRPTLHSLTTAMVRGFDLIANNTNIMTFPTIPNRGAHRKALIGQQYRMAYRNARTCVAPPQHTLIPEAYEDYLRMLGYTEDIIEKALER